MGYDSWLAGYRTSTVEVWCKNPKCENHTGPTDVKYEEEYGAGWMTPDECRCGGEWMFDAPKEEEDD